MWVVSSWDLKLLKRRMLDEDEDECFRRADGSAAQGGRPDDAPKRGGVDSEDDLVPI